MIIYCIPFYYLLKSRLKSTYKKISWLLIYPLPACFVCYYANDELELQQFMVVFLLSIAVFINIYEIGYIVNDTVTIHKERNPTIRNSEDEAKLLSENWQKIALVRVTFSILLFGFICYLDIVYSYGLNILAFIFLLSLEVAFFYIHNTIRSRWNVVTFSMLSFGKYLTPLMLFISSNNLCAYILISFFMLPMLRTIEHSTKATYDLSQLIEFVGVIDEFRVKYYAIMFTVLLALSFLYRSHLKSGGPMFVALTVSGYFLAYRIASLFMVKKSIYRRY